MLRRLCLERHKVEGVDRIRCEHGWLSVRGKSGRVFLRPMLAGVVARTKSAGELARTPRDVSEGGVCRAWNVTCAMRNSQKL